MGTMLLVNIHMYVLVEVCVLSISKLWIHSDEILKAENYYYVQKEVIIFGEDLKRIKVEKHLFLCERENQKSI